MSGSYENYEEAYEKETMRREQKEALELIEDWLYEEWLDSLRK